MTGVQTCALPIFLRCRAIGRYAGLSEINLVIDRDWDTGSVGDGNIVPAFLPPGIVRFPPQRFRIPYAVLVSEQHVPPVDFYGQLVLLFRRGRNRNGNLSAVCNGFRIA